MIKQSRPLISLSYRMRHSQTGVQMGEYEIKANEAAGLERDGELAMAEAAWIKASRLAIKESNKEWEDGRAHRCARAQGKIISVRQLRDMAALLMGDAA